MHSIIVLGAGMVGSAIAIDLAKKHKVTLTDVNQKVLDKVHKKCDSLTVQTLDVTQKEVLQSTIKQHDLVVCAVPGFLGYETLKNIIEAEMNVIDISFFSENSLDLDTLAKEKNVTAIVDCGVAPGMDNVILGYYNEKMKLTDFECLVGGLPKVKKWPFSYKAPFSPIDVIEEYTRPARYVEQSEVVVREPLTDCEFVEFEGVGTLESFNSDGLRSIIFTMPHIPNMKEKTLRYPGHVEYVRVLKESGFFNTNEIEVNGTKISPLEFTSNILFSEWKLGETEEELTVMRITLKGENEQGEIEEVVYNLHDEFCQNTQTSSMARTTGYTAAA
ncbi:MAG: saccharopine dehydrogenase-like NADP-dependent oxidoreductase, partial [Flavobacteriaceae bacterium]